MDETQDLTKVHEQMCGVTAERHMHKPSINDQHDHEELLVSTSTTGEHRMKMETGCCARTRQHPIGTISKDQDHLRT